MIRRTAIGWAAVAAATFDLNDRVVAVAVAGRGPGSAPGLVAAFVAAGARVVDGGPAPVIDAALERFGRLDVLVALSGEWADPGVDAAAAGGTEAIVRRDLLGPFAWAQAAHAVMATQEGGGSIVNVSRAPGRGGGPGGPAWAAAHAGLVNLTASLAAEWAPAIRVHCVSGTEGADEDGLGRVCLFLAGPAGRSMSGANLVVGAN
jgi:NAD(P)-dependent dehydrogenase (short-subunit alcohol dehydrogenase family)